MEETLKPLHHRLPLRSINQNLMHNKSPVHAWYNLTPISLSNVWQHFKIHSSFSNFFDDTARAKDTQLGTTKPLSLMYSSLSINQMWIILFPFFLILFTLSSLLSILLCQATKKQNLLAPNTSYHLDSEIIDIDDDDDDEDASDNAVPVFVKHTEAMLDEIDRIVSIPTFHLIFCVFWHSIIMSCAPLFLRRKLKWKMCRNLF